MFRSSLLLSICSLFSCHQLAAADAAGSKTQSLSIRIEEGDGLTYSPGSRATRGITVQVVDESGQAVESATVSFTLPETGPGGVFPDGSKSVILTTHADGRASVWGMRWNRQAGSFDVRITATKGEARAGTVCSQRLAEAPGPSRASGGSSHKWLWIGLAAAGAAGAGVVVVAKGGASSNGCSSTVVLPQNPCSSTPSSLGVTIIGQPTISLGRP